MPLVMCKKDATGTFRRSIRDKAGNILETLEFPPGEAVDVPFEKLPAVQGDFYHGLVPVRPLYLSKPNADGLLVPNGKYAVIDPEDLEKMLKGDVDDATMEAATAPDASVVLPVVAAVPEPEVSGGKKPTERSGK